jgi:hypothetical protein
VGLAAVGDDSGVEVGDVPGVKPARLTRQGGP